MNVTLDCPGCGRQLRVNAQFVGKKVRCPRCGTTSTVPAAGGPEPFPEPFPAVVPVGVFAPEARPDREEPPEKEVAPPPARARAPRGVEGDARCPECDAGMAAEAVLCIECGYNRQTGKRLKTVSRRIARHWYFGGFSLIGRVVAFVLVFAFVGSILVAMSRNPHVEVGVLILTPVAVAALGALLIGTFYKGTVTKDSHGTPILIKHYWICFIPSGQATIDLTDYRRIRLTHSGGGSDGSASLGGAAAGLALFGLLGLLIALLARRSATGTFMVEIAGGSEDFDVTPQVVYRGRSEQTMRTISDALEQVAGLRYG